MNTYGMSFPSPVVPQVMDSEFVSFKDPEDGVISVKAITNGFAVVHEDIPRPQTFTHYRTKLAEFLERKTPDESGCVYTCRSELFRLFGPKAEEALETLIRGGMLRHANGCWYRFKDRQTAIREKVEGYMAHRHGLYDQLPDRHPYKHKAPETT